MQSLISSKVVQKLYESKKFSDVCFLVEGQRIKGHRCLLSSSCDYFETMLFGSTQESKLDLIQLKNTPVKQFTQVVHFVYTEEVTIKDWPMDDVLSLLQLAHEYNYQELIRVICGFIQVDDCNLIQVYNFGEKYEIQDLMSKCVDWTEDHMEDIVQRPEIHKHLSVYFLKVLLSRDTLMLSEEQILNLVISWSSDRKDDEIRTILPLIRWQQLPSRVFGLFLFNLILKDPQLIKCPEILDPMPLEDPRGNLLGKEDIHKVYLKFAEDWLKEDSKPSGILTDVQKDAPILSPSPYYTNKGGTIIVQFNKAALMSTIRFSVTKVNIKSIKCVDDNGGQVYTMTSLLKKFETFRVYEAQFVTNRIKSIQINFNWKSNEEKTNLQMFAFKAFHIKNI